MKKMFNILLVIVFVLFPLFINSLLAELPAPPGTGPASAPNGGTPVGAPVDNGILVLILLGTVYGAYKLYMLRKEKMLEQSTK
jgi:hypothetical protein